MEGQAGQEALPGHRAGAGEYALPTVAGPRPDTERCTLSPDTWDGFGAQGIGEEWAKSGMTGGERGSALD